MLEKPFGDKMKLETGTMFCFTLNINCSPKLIFVTEVKVNVKLPPCFLN